MIAPAANDAPSLSEAPDNYSVSEAACEILDPSASTWARIPRTTKEVQAQLRALGVNGVSGVRIKLDAPKAVVDEYLKKFSIPVEESFSQQGQGSVSSATNSATIQDPLGNLPQKPENTNSISEYLQGLINSTWGTEGRTAADIMNVAKMHGISVTSSSLSGILFSLNQSNKIRRTRGENDTTWKYFPSKEYSLRQA